MFGNFFDIWNIMVPSLFHEFKVETVFDEILQKWLMSPAACPIKSKNPQKLTNKHLEMLILIF